MQGKNTVAFLDALDDASPSVHTFQTFSDREKNPALARVFNGPLAQHADALAALNQQGAGVFFTVQRTDGTGRKGSNITSPRALFVDSDVPHDGPLVVPVPPSARVQSSPGKEHIYWFLKPGEALDAVADAQRTLARALDTDPSVFDLPRVMRLPGSYHVKGEPFQVTVTELVPENRYTIADILKGFEQPSPDLVVHFAQWKMDKLLKTVRMSTEGGRNSALYKAAFQLKDLVGPALQEDTVRAGLTRAGEAVGLAPDEITQCIGSAFKSDVPSTTAQAILSAPAVEGNLAIAPAPTPSVVMDSKQDADVARVFLSQLGADNEHCKIVDGVLYQYTNEGLWASRDVKWARGVIQRYHGAHVMEENGNLGKLNVTAMKRNSILDLAMHASHVQADDFFDTAEPGVLFSNGFVSPFTGDLNPRAPSPAHRARTRLDVDFDLGAPSPRWDAFLDELFPAKNGCKELVQEVAGAALLGLSPQYGKCVIFLGGGANGKSVLLQALTEHLFERAFVSHVAPNKWGEPKYLHGLRDSLLNVVAELPSWNVMNTDSFKSVVAGDPIQGRELYQQAYGFRPRCAHIFACNELPATKDYSKGFWRRFLVIPFDAEFDGTERSVEVLARFADEREGIASWAMKGAVRLLANKGYTEVQATREVQEVWREDVDSVLGFARACCSDDKDKWTQSAELYRAYGQWCESTRRMPVTATRFGRRLRELGTERRRTAAGKQYNLDLMPVASWEIEAG